MLFNVEKRLDDEIVSGYLMQMAENYDVGKAGKKTNSDVEKIES